MSCSYRAPGGQGSLVQREEGTHLGSLLCPLRRALNVQQTTFGPGTLGPVVLCVVSADVRLAILG